MDFSLSNIMEYLLYFFSCFFTKKQKNDITNPLCKCDSCDTINCNCDAYYNIHNPITTASPKKVRFSSFTDDH